MMIPNGPVTVSRPEPATDLADDIREKVVLALSTTTAQQCVQRLGTPDGYRCALGVALGALGFSLRLVPRVIAIGSDGISMVLDWHCEMLDEDVPAINALLPSNFMSFLVHHNDHLMWNFDQIAKGVKDWTPSWRESSQKYSVR